MFSGERKSGVPRPTAARDLGERAEVGAVEVAPHEGRDHGGHGVRHEDEQADGLATRGAAQLSSASAKKRARPSMIGTWMMKNRATRPRPARNCGSVSARRVVARPGEHLAADELALEQAEVARVDQGDHEHRDEDDEERQQEEVRGEVLLALRRTGVPLRCGCCVARSAVSAVACDTMAPLNRLLMDAGPARAWGGAPAARAAGAPRLTRR